MQCRKYEELFSQSQPFQEDNKFNGRAESRGKETHKIFNYKCRKLNERIGSKLSKHSKRYVHLFTSVIRTLEKVNKGEDSSIQLVVIDK